MNAIVESNGPGLCVVPGNPIPEGGRMAYMTTRDNVRLRYAVWRNNAVPGKGTICLVQGRAEFLEKYFETIADFLARGFSVATFDWRGQGGSQRLIDNPKWGYVDKFEDYCVDLESFHQDILLPDCPPPYYLVGHSMGGMVSLMSAVRDRMKFDRMFLSAPMLALPDTPLSASGIAGIAEAACFLGMGNMPLRRKVDRTPTKEHFPGNPLTSDIDRYMRMVQTYAKRPELEIMSPTFRWVAAAFRAISNAAQPEFPGSVRVPVLMMAAARDKVVSTPAIEQMGLRMRTGRHAVIGNARHEMFMETDDVRGQLFAAFDAFITEQSA